MNLGANPFALAPNEVAELSNDEFVTLLNQLIHDRALRLRISVDQVRTTLRTNDADGGVDASVDTGTISDEFLGVGLSAWQFKQSYPSFSTKDKSKSELEIELEKPSVQDIFRVGGGYTLVVGRQTPAGGRNGQAVKLKRLKELTANAGCSGEVRLLAAEHVAAWTRQDPAALLAFRPQLRGLTSAKAVLSQPQHSVVFEVNPERELILEYVRVHVLSESPSTFHVRIQGRAGVGKTRLALEAVRRYGIAEATFYTASAVTDELFEWMAAQSEAKLVLIVDESDEPDARRYIDLASRCEGRLKLITVGPGASRGDGIFVLNPIDSESIEKILRTESDISFERARWIAGRTQGYIKLALLVARAIARGSTNIADLKDDFDISLLVQKMLTSSETGLRALRGVALLSRLGMEGDLEKEGETVAEFMGISWNDMWHSLGPAMHQGIVTKRGRYWSVSPELLAIWLAGEIWIHQASRIGVFLDALPSESARQACLERLASLRDIVEVEEVVGALLGPTGPFLDLTTVGDDHTGRLFFTLAKGYPLHALRSVGRLVGNSSHEELVAFRTGRQQVVWLLHQLMERRDTFFEAARLLRRLAEAENEDYFSNNATDYWNKSFLTLFGQTEVPVLERLLLIDEALIDSSPAVRILGVSGLEAMLKYTESMVFQGPGETLPPEYWRPKTWEEVAQIKREALSRILSTMSDPDDDVSARAREALRQSARGLAALGLADELISGLDQLHPQSDDEVRKTWEIIRELLRFEGKHVSDNQRARLETMSKEYFGDTQVDQMKRYLGPGSFANWEDTEDGWNKSKEVARRLAKQAHSSTDWTPLLPWLFSGNAHNVYSFALYLGEIDIEHKWIDRLVDFAVGSADPRLLSGYLSGRVATDPSEQEWFDRLLDAWAEDQARTELTADATFRGPPSDRAASRLLYLVKHKGLQSSLLGWLRQTNWITGMSIETAVEIVECVLDDGSPHAITAGLGIIASWLEQFATLSSNELLGVTWRLLEAPGGWTSGSNSDFLWLKLGESLVEEEPVRLASILMRIYRESDPPYHDQRLRLLVAAARAHPKEILELIDPFPMDFEPRMRLQWALQDIDFFTLVSPAAVAEWVLKRGAEGAEWVAGCLKVPEAELPEVVRFLLIEYPEETGGHLGANFLSGSWTGSQVKFLEQKLEAVRRWERDPEPRIRRWASELTNHIVNSIVRARLRESEERW